MASVQAAQAAPLDVTNAWFRALPGKLPAAGYFTLQNNTRTALEITGAQSDACGMLMIHESSQAGGVNQMAMRDRVPLPVGGRAVFAPGGLHLMCTDPTPKMKIGARVAVTLSLSNLTSLSVPFTVKGPSGK
jgi:copper(I)-binding protein